MSTYRASTSTITAVRVPTESELLEAALARLGEVDLDCWVGSVQINAIAQRSPAVLARGLSAEITSAQHLAAALGRRHEVSTSRLTEALVQEASGHTMAQVDSLLQSGTAAAAAGDLEAASALGAEADRALRAALGVTASRLRVDERSVVSSVAERALRRLGYVVDVEQGSHSTGAWAIRDHTVLAVLVQDGGTLEIDTAGCSADACRPIVAELVEAMAAEGVVVEVVRDVPHGDDRGGQLIQRAVAACVGSRFAEGVVRQFEIGVPVGLEAEPAGRAARAGQAQGLG